MGSRVELLEPTPPGVMPANDESDEFSEFVTRNVSRPPLTLSVIYEDENGQAQEKMSMIIWELLQGEKIYYEELQTCIECIHILDEMGALGAKDLRMLDCILFLHNTSSGVVQRLENLSQEGADRLEVPDFFKEVADVFGNSLTKQLERYNQNLNKRIFPLFRRKRRNSPSFKSACHQIRSIYGAKLRKLLLAPEHRLLTYHSRLEQLYDSAPSTPSKEFRDTVAKIGKLAKEADKELEFAKNEEELEVLEDQFPDDDLDLTSESSETMNQLIRRKSTGTDKSLGNKGKNLTKSGVNSYKLKEKIRLCEVWLKADGIEDVSECGKSPDQCFVIGWPTTNYVAEFQSVEERNDWFRILDKTIGKERDKEYPKVVTVPVYYKSVRNNQVKRIKLNCYSTATDFLRMALVEFQLDDNEPQMPHQLWVRSGKENAPYPLQGHESPFAIFMSHVRDSIPEGGSEVDLRQFSDDLSGFQRVKCFFILRPKQGSTGMNARKVKRSKRQTGGNLMEIVRSKLTRQGSGGDLDKAIYGSSKPAGVLFCKDLSTLVSEQEPVPKAVMMLMEHIFTYGVFVDGIFRKSPNQRTVKELKQRLDNGELVKLDGEYYPTVAASVLKDFLRNIPGTLLKCDLYGEWVSLCDAKESDKASHVKQLLSELPSANYDVLKHLMCILYHVADKCHINQMTSTSLAVCVGPSLLDKPDNNVQESVRLLPHVTQFLIDNAVDLFGADCLELFGKPPKENMFGKNESSEESDPGQVRPETSSMDSFNVSSAVSPGNSRPESSLVRHPANLSRDSGLSDVHFTDEMLPSISPAAPPILNLPGGRSFSHSEEPEEINIVSDSVTTKSVEDLSRRDRILEDELDADRWRSVTLDRGTNPDQLWKDLSDEKNDSVDYLDKPHAMGLRNSKRLTSGTLQRSESGEHLLLSETGARKSLPAVHGGTTGVSRKSLTGMTLSLPVSGEMDVITSDSNASSPDSSADKNLLLEESPGPTKISRDSSGRKPARYRKGQLFKSSSLSPEEDEDEQDTSKYPPNSESSGKIVIRCNSSKDGSDSPFAAREKNAELPPSQFLFVGGNLEPHSEASSSGASSLTSLTSTDSDGGSPERPNQRFRETKLAVSSSRELRTHRRKVGHESDRERLPRSFMETVNTADSSTVTETSSDEEESTPVVSRESSRAQELKGKAREMFSPTGISTGAAGPVNRPVSLAPSMNVTIRPMNSSAWLEMYKSRNMNSSLDTTSSSTPLQKAVSSSGISHARSPTSTAPSGGGRLGHGLQPRSNDSLPLNASRLGANRLKPAVTSAKSLPNYEETVRRGLVARQPSLTKPEYKTTAPVRPSSLHMDVVGVKPTVLPSAIARDQKQTTVAYVSGQVKDRIRRYDREGLRRKTIGGDEILALVQQSPIEDIPISPSKRLLRAGSSEHLGPKQTTKPSQLRNYLLTPEQQRHRVSAPPESPELSDRSSQISAVESADSRNSESSDKSEINWSVRKLKSIFDDQKPIPDRTAKPMWETARGGDGFSSLDRSLIRKPPISATNNYSSTNFTAGLARSRISTAGGVLTVSEAPGNYPVVKPPPLAPAFSKIREAPIGQLTLIKSPTESGKIGDERMGQPGLVKNLVSTFDGGKERKAQLNGRKGKHPGEESYV